MGDDIVEDYVVSEERLGGDLDHQSVSSIMLQLQSDLLDFHHTVYRLE